MALLLSGRVLVGDGRHPLRCRVAGCATDRRAALYEVLGKPVSALCLDHARELGARVA